MGEGVTTWVLTSGILPPPADNPVPSFGRSAGPWPGGASEHRGGQAGGGGRAAASRAAYPWASASESYFVRGQKKPRKPSPLVRGTTCTCRCGTDCDTTLLTARKEPCAPRPWTTAPDSRCAAPISTGSSSDGRSTS